MFYDIPLLAKLVAKLPEFTWWMFADVRKKKRAGLQLLTGWDLAGVRTKYGLNRPVTKQSEEETSWWRKIFKQN
jgi:hypothetical protein